MWGLICARTRSAWRYRWDAGSVMSGVVGASVLMWLGAWQVPSLEAAGHLTLWGHHGHALHASRVPARATRMNAYLCSNNSLALQPCTTADTVPFTKTHSTTLQIVNSGYPDLMITPSVGCPPSPGPSSTLVVSCSATSSGVVYSGTASTITVSYTMTNGGLFYPGALTEDLPVYVSYSAYGISGTLGGDIFVTGARFRLSVPDGTRSRDLALCTAACFSAHYEQGTMGYRSLNVARNVTLVYNGETVRPHPFVYADITTTKQFPTTGMLIASMTINGVATTFRNGDTRSFFAPITTPPPGDTVRHVRIGQQFDASSYSTGLYPTVFTVMDSSRSIVRNTNDGTATISQFIPIINGQGSSIARGWGIKGLQRLYKVGSSNFLIVEGDGSFTQFTGNVSTAWPSPGSSDLSVLWLNSQRYYQDGSIVTFDNAGYMISAFNPKNGLTTQFQYETWSGGERLVRILDPYRKINGSPAVTTLTYNANGLASITEPGPAGRTTTIAVDATSHLTSITDPDNLSTTFAYDPQDRLSAVTDRRHDVLQTYYYNLQTGLLDSVRGPTVPVDQGDGTTTLGSAATHYAPWQPLGVPPGPTTGAAPYAWTDTTRAGWIAGPLHDTTKYVFDPWGQPTKVTDPLGHVTTSDRIARLNYYTDSAGNVRTVQVLSPLASTVHHPDGSVDAYGYDFTWAMIRLLWEQHPGQSAVSRAYNAQNQYWLLGYAPIIDSTWGPGIQAKHYYYTSAHLPYGLPDSVAALTTASVVTGQPPATFTQWTHYTYDPTHHRLTSVRDPLNDTTLYTYDAVFGNLASTQQPGNRTTTVTFDSHGRDSVTHTPQMANVVTVYDAVDRVTSRTVLASPNVVTTYQYDALYQTAVLDGLNQRYATHRDALGRVGTVYAANSATTARTYRYDLENRQTSVTNRRNQRVQLTYDAVGRLLTRTGSGLADAFQYAVIGTADTLVAASNAVAWDTLSGNQTQAAQTGLRSVTRFATSPTTPLTAAQSATDSWTATDSIGLTVPGDGNPGYPTVWHTAVANVMPSQQIQIGTGGVETQIFDINQRLHTTKLLGTTTQAMVGFSNWATAYTTTNRPLGASYSVTALDSVFRRAYGYDSVNRVSVVQQASGALQRQYRYDGLGRLAAVAYRTQPCQTWPGTPDVNYGWTMTCVTNPDSTQTFSYDAVGNRTDQANAYDPGNEQRTFGHFTYTFDADGNVSQKTNTATGRVWTYGWDALNRLTSVTSNGVTVTYEYDALGRLARRKMNGTIDRHWLYLGSHIQAELDGSLHRRVEYTYTPQIDAPQASITVTQNGGVFSVQRHLLDELGNVLGQTDGTGVMERVDYDAWGKPTVRVASANKLLWKGLMWEDTVGLYYVRNRWYDPDVGRFLSEDPMGIQGGINLYVFANNDPINAADPSGLCPPCQVSEDGLRFIEYFEGYRANAYLDQSGYSTIGYGHRLFSGEQISGPLSQEQAEDLLRQDIQQRVQSALDAIKVDLDQNEVDALASFIFNIGADAFEKSTLFRELNQGDKNDVSDQMLRWVYSKGSFLSDLSRRRRAEGRLFDDGDYLP